MAKFTSTKLFDGYSTCFRQWKAETTHCKFLHGYGVSFRVWFEGELDERNWVWDFGGMKRAKNTIDSRSPSDYFKFLLDHTTIIAEDDPQLWANKIEAYYHDVDQLNASSDGCASNEAIFGYSSFNENMNDLFR